MVTITINSLFIVSLMLVLLIALIGINQYLLFSISSSTSRGATITGGATQVQQSRSSPISSGEKTSYGISFSQQGYEQLIGYQKSITLTQDEQPKYEELIMEIPHECCNGAIGQCDCGHAVALKGLVKLLLQNDYTDQEIEDEAYKWRQLFFSQNFPM
jgi:hypothetical protein